MSRLVMLNDIIVDLDAILWVGKSGERYTMDLRGAKEDDIYYLSEAEWQRLQEIIGAPPSTPVVK
jgi:hypothetical protein